MEVVTGRLDVDDLEDEIASVASLLTESGITSMRLEFGGGCDFNKIECGHKILLSTPLIPDFIAEQIDLDVITLGYSELFLQAPVLI